MNGGSMLDLPPLIMDGITTYNNSSVSTKCLLVSGLIVVKTLTTCAFTKGYRKGVEVAILVSYSLILSKHYIQMSHIKSHDYS